MSTDNNTVYIVTPSYNAVDTIEQTILSVVTQSGDMSIRYHVQDGGSTDGTWKLLQRWKALLYGGFFPIQCRKIEFTYEVSKDEGMYDALVKGIDKLKVPQDSFMTWINADDWLMPRALSFANKVGNDFSREVSWFSGIPCVDVKGVPHIEKRLIPTELIKLGLCEGKNWWFIQQEGTFFRKWLYDIVKPHENIKMMKLAGDWNLWRLFAQHTEMYFFNYSFGVFRIRDGQLSQSQYSAYMSEINNLVSISERYEALKRIDNQVSSLTAPQLQITFPSNELHISRINVSLEYRP